MIWDSLHGVQRSFRQDALRLTAALPLVVIGRRNIPQSGPAVIVMNHYHRPGFQAFWISLAISALTPVEIHWTMTRAWTNDGTPGAGLRARLSPYFLPRLAHLYGFTSMPPMPPRPFEKESRASAVRHILSTARQTPPPILGLAPEGQDNPAGGLMRPHPGVGRLLAHLMGMRFVLVPVGVYEDEQQLILNWGSGFQAVISEGLAPAEIDHRTADQVMQAIASLLPETLRGAYGVQNALKQQTPETGGL